MVTGQLVAHWTTLAAVVCGLTSDAVAQSAPSSAPRPRPAAAGKAGAGPRRRSIVSCSPSSRSRRSGATSSARRRPRCRRPTASASTSRPPTARWRGLRAGQRRPSRRAALPDEAGADHRRWLAPVHRRQGGRRAAHERCAAVERRCPPRRSRRRARRLALRARQRQRHRAPDRHRRGRLDDGLGAPARWRPVVEGDRFYAATAGGTLHARSRRWRAALAGGARQRRDRAGRSRGPRVRGHERPLALRPRRRARPGAVAVPHPGRGDRVDRRRGSGDRGDARSGGPVVQDRQRRPGLAPGAVVPAGRRSDRRRRQRPRHRLRAHPPPHRS